MSLAIKCSLRAAPATVLVTPSSHSARASSRAPAEPDERMRSSAVWFCMAVCASSNSGGVPSRSDRV